MKNDTKINLYFNPVGDDLQNIIDEVILKKYIESKNIHIN